MDHMEQPTSTAPTGPEPQNWEADVILNDGDIATLRPITPADRDAIRAFYDRVSDQSKYLRFFGTHPTLTDDDLDRWLHTDGYDKVTLIMVERGNIVAVAGYSIVEHFLPARVGDVSFLVQDSHHGKGVANILLEHLAEIGREGKVERFFAEMLTQNRRMVQVFVRAGYSAKPELEDGFIRVDFRIAPNENSRDVMERRELRAEANSIQRLLNPRSVAVVGTLSSRQLASAGFNGSLHNLHSVDELYDLDKPVDLVVIEFQGHGGTEAMQAAAAAGAKGVVVISRSQNPNLSPDQARDIVLAARDYGLRALGPAALGLINTNEAVRLNASPAPMPRSGQVGLFTQSAGVATLALSHALQLGCGLSNFIAAGSFADVTGNDVMQFWSQDENTRICLLSLDSIGNPRKFFRVLRRLALDKHVVVFLPSRALKSARHYAVEGLSAASPAALDEIIRCTGAMVVTRRDAMLDIAQLLARQPVPQGRRIAVMSNSSGLTSQMEQAAWRFGLRPHATTVVDDPAPAITEQARRALEDPGIDAVLCAVVEVGEFILKDAHSSLSQLATTTTDTPLIASFVGFDIPDFRTAEGPEAPGQLPVFGTYADAIEALATIIDNERRRALARPNPSDEFANSAGLAEARGVVAEVLTDSPTGRWATDEECARILRAYGIEIVPWTPVCTLDEAIAAGREYGWDVVLKCSSQMVRGRSELPTVVRSIHDEESMVRAWTTITQLTRDLHLGEDPAILIPVVQRMVTAGASLTVRAIEDPVVGPMVSAGISGLPSDLLGDVEWRVPPLRRTDALDMLSCLKASPLLAGYRGTKAAKLHRVEEVMMQLAQLKDDIAALVDIELSPVIAGVAHTAVVGARMRIAPLGDVRDPLARSLS